MTSLIHEDKSNKQINNNNIVFLSIQIKIELNYIYIRFIRILSLIIWLLIYAIIHWKIITEQPIIFINPFIEYIKRSIHQNVD